MKIAIPSNAPGGLDSTITEHFGHCDAFTLVDVEDGEIKKTAILPHGGHARGGCMGAVMLLKQQGVDAMIAAGMGMRPFTGFLQVGIEVYLSDGADTAEQAVRLILDGTARKYQLAQVCSGGGSSTCGRH